MEIIDEFLGEEEVERGDERRGLRGVGAGALLGMVVNKWLCVFFVFDCHTSKNPAEAAP